MNARMIFCTALCAPFCLAASPAVQESPDPSVPQTIVVTGKKAKSTKEEMRDFVRALTHTPVGTQISRFEHQVCPIVVGLPKAQAQFVAERMRRVAKEAQIPVGGAKCVPNVALMITSDKAYFMQVLRRRYPEFFGYMSQPKVRRLVRQTGPAVAWQMPGPLVSGDGTAIEGGANMTIQGASRIRVAARPSYDQAVVVVERGALAGLTATQLADYAAMRAYSAADPQRLNSGAAPTILRVLEVPMGSEVPATLTKWDIGFLRGLYDAPRDLKNAAQRSEIAKALAREVQGQTKE